jgi:hypothetical protein
VTAGVDRRGEERPLLPRREGDGPRPTDEGHRIGESPMQRQRTVGDDITFMQRTGDRLGRVGVVRHHGAVILRVERTMGQQGFVGLKQINCR